MVMVKGNSFYKIVTQLIVAEIISSHTEDDYLLMKEKEILTLLNGISVRLVY